VSPESAEVRTLRQLYSGFNERQLDTVLAMLHPAVSWPAMMNRRVVTGRDQVRRYWEAQWAIVSPTVEPLEFDQKSATECSVRVAQTIHGLDGKVIDAAEIVHDFRFDNGQVLDMRVRGEAVG
jgi:hypothetical protein